MKIVPEQVTLEWITPDAEKVIEAAGRTCYKSSPRGEGSEIHFIRMLIDRGHEAMLEHASASFRIITDRGISHEIVRHRLASYAQESTRYCNYGTDKFENECTFIEPRDLDDKQFLIWERACIKAEIYYFKLLEAGCKPQIARSVLPTSLKTEICMTANFREWRHFIALRAASSAHPQIQELAKMIQRQLYHEAPTVFGGLV